MFPERTKMSLDEALRTRMRDNKEQREYDEKEKQWMNSERN